VAHVGGAYAADATAGVLGEAALSITSPTRQARLRRRPDQPRSDRPSGLGQIPTDWQIVETGDFNGDHTSDVLWFNSTFGVIAMWLMDGGQIIKPVGVGFIGSGWTIQSTNAD
jgi:hypothetical protein